MITNYIKKLILNLPFVKKEIDWLNMNIAVNKRANEIDKVDLQDYKNELSKIIDFFYDNDNVLVHSANAYDFVVKQINEKYISIKKLNSLTNIFNKCSQKNRSKKLKISARKKR